MFSIISVELRTLNCSIAEMIVSIHFTQNYPFIISLLSFSFDVSGLSSVYSWTCLA